MSRRNKHAGLPIFGWNLRLGVKIWLFFMLFVCAVFLLMWLFQVVLLGNFYESFKMRDTVRVARRLVAAMDEEDFEDQADQMAMYNQVCIVVLTQDGRVAYSDCVYDNRCLLHSINGGLYFYLQDLRSSDTNTINRRMFDVEMQSQMLVYGTALFQNGEIDGYLFLNTQLAPVESTVSILERQTMLITAILALCAVLLSTFIANYISHPLTQITRSARRLAHGDYTVRFDGGGYAEADELADTLNFAAKELSKTDEMQRDLVANVSHDLRTPLTMMKAYAEMIRDLSGNNPVKREQHLNIIIEETDRLSLLVNDMLDLSKLESGTQKLDRTIFDIAELMREITNRYAEISEKMGYHIYFTPDASCFVCCDEGKINRVIGNLINNAINYTSKEEKNVFVTQKNTPNGVRIEVRDTGDGIEEDKIKLIFDKYYRSENHKREVVGTGLGLSIVKAILKMHEYDYGVNSKLGEGSTFWFLIRDVVPKTGSDEGEHS